MLPKSIMKVSILMTTYNKNEMLPNVLYSIIRQNPPFPYEICIIDDCSDIDPEPIIRKFAPNTIYKRLEKHVGFMYAGNNYLDLISKNTDVVVLQSCDVIHVQNNTIEELCKFVREKTISLAEVIDIPININLYQNFDIEIKEILSNWNKYITTIAQKANRERSNTQIDKIEYPLWTKYSGKNYPGWLFFLGAIKREDLEKIEYDKNSCDAVIAPKMKSLNFKAEYPEVKGIHQRHPKTIYYCPIVKECEYDCGRRQGKCQK
uniref:Putative glycosyltransferase n=1 Tax=viral metagenome TaxID=1070528 RepID=A0A6M3XEL3_9ZZZZ